MGAGEFNKTQLQQEPVKKHGQIPVKEELLVCAQSNKG